MTGRFYTKVNEVPVKSGRGTRYHGTADHGSRKTFTVTHDPDGLFDGSKYGIMQIEEGIMRCSFPDGMKFVFEGNELVVRKGFLYYTEDVFENDVLIHAKDSALNLTRVRV